MLVFGTRPEAIKMCPLVNELKRRSDQFEVVVCVTGQHRRMLDQVLDTFDVVPDCDLDIMSMNQTLFDITCHVLLDIKAVLRERCPRYRPSSRRYDDVVRGRLGGILFAYPRWPC